MSKRRSTTPLSIGEVANETGLSVSAVRYYDDLGLIRSSARSGGKRRFEESVVERVRVITLVQQAGFTLSEIAQLLDKGAPARVRRRALIQAKLVQVDQQLARLQAVRAALEEASSCGCESLEHCGLLTTEEWARLGTPP